MENKQIKKKLITLGEELEKQGYTYVLGMKNNEPCVSYTINGKAEALVSIFTGMLENNPYLAIVMKKALENFGRNQLLARAKGEEAN